jgi:hypothetical protein
MGRRRDLLLKYLREVQLLCPGVVLPDFEEATTAELRVRCMTARWNYRHHRVMILYDICMKLNIVSNSNRVDKRAMYDLFKLFHPFYAPIFIHACESNLSFEEFYVLVEPLV